MGNFLTRGLRALFLDKKARGKGGKRPAARPMTPERQDLIRQAMAVRREKAQMLDDLDDEAQAKLKAMAMLSMGEELEDGEKTKAEAKKGKKKKR